MQGGTATLAARTSARPVVVAALGCAVTGAVAAWGLIATGQGHALGTALAPFLYRWEPRVEATALAAGAAVLAALWVAPRLSARLASPYAFAGAALALGLGLRLGIGFARQGAFGWYSVYQVGQPESASEYLPVLPALDFGLGFFLDTFAEIGTSLPVHAVGHPPGLLTTLHALGIDTAEGMAALTIGAGALSVPLTYVLARRLLDEDRARTATLLYAFAPTAVLHGVTSADALYATLALIAACVLMARRRLARTLGPAALAIASFFSYANLAVGAWAAILTWRRDGLPRAAVLAGACALGLAASYGALHLATGFDPFGAIAATESVYREGIASTRPYAFWVVGSPTAFLLTSGLPLAWLAFRALGSGQDVAVALFGVLAVAAVLGFSKAETERIYLFLVPLLCVAAATNLSASRLQAVLAALAVQALATELLFYTVW